MATRIDNAVALSHAQADRVRELLNDYAASLSAHAHRTRSAVVRESCDRRSAQCRDLANYIVEHLWSWTDNNPNREEV